MSKCKKCGQCCLRFHINMSKQKLQAALRKAKKEKNTEQVLEWSRLLKIIVWIRPDSNESSWTATCKVLEFNTKTGKYFCGEYEKRPEMCKQYPYGRNSEYPGCGYNVSKKGE